jgi:hypothetical protein
VVAVRSTHWFIDDLVNHHAKCFESVGGVMPSASAVSALSERFSPED